MRVGETRISRKGHEFAEWGGNDIVSGRCLMEITQNFGPLFDRFSAIASRNAAPASYIQRIER